MTTCSHSIGARLSKKLALFTMLVLGGVSLAAWMSVKMLVVERNGEDLQRRCELFSTVLASEARSGGEAAVLAWLRSDAPMRGDSRLEVWRADGRILHADATSAALAHSEHTQSQAFTIAAPDVPGGELRARFTVDYTRDALMGQRWAWILILVTLAAGAMVAAASYWHVRRQLRELNALAAQTRAISPRRLDQRLVLDDPAEELLPWIEQFNALMARLEQAYAQLEGFNADVAHELRTPLANLIGETELALARERPAEALRETLLSNLEEMQRMSLLVNDMLFLSQADRGAVARRGAPVSLAALALQVLEFHEASFEEAGLAVQIVGDATVAVDEALFKRALSNLLGNAVRFADRGSTVSVRIAPEAAEQVRVLVQNAGTEIEASALPQLFDRFFRGDASRCCDSGAPHHGLGLAIVAAIARMHAGATLAESRGGVTRVGFTLAASAAPLATQGSA
jgi:two-component system, OmpR family, heavy metal sensor histidine kinase CusS